MLRRSLQVRNYAGHHVSAWRDTEPLLKMFFRGAVKISFRFQMLRPLSPKKFVSKGNLITSPLRQMSYS